MKLSRSTEIDCTNKYYKIQQQPLNCHFMYQRVIAGTNTLLCIRRRRRTDVNKEYLLNDSLTGRARRVSDLFTSQNDWEILWPLQIQTQRVIHIWIGPTRFDTTLIIPEPFALFHDLFHDSYRFPLQQCQKVTLHHVGYMCQNKIPCSLQKNYTIKAGPHGCEITRYRKKKLKIYKSCVVSHYRENQTKFIKETTIFCCFYDIDTHIYKTV